MARGWESKSVEAQMEEAAVSSSTKPRLTPQQIEAKQKRETLMLTKKKLAADLERRTTPRHQKMLKKAIEEVEKQLGGDGVGTHSERARLMDHLVHPAVLARALSICV